MTQEQKDLLLKDLCARLPYDVFIKDTYSGHYGRMYKISHEYVFFVSRLNINLIDAQLISVKPYLRPVSSMTKKEEKEISFLLNYEFYIDDDYALVAEDNRHRIRLDLMQIYIDWLNAHHFDFRGLIPMDLAIEVTEENNPYKE